jgi:endonuclease/exonuclease/phosphatase family metal-dependent hydrolase
MGRARHDLRRNALAAVGGAAIVTVIGIGVGACVPAGEGCDRPAALCDGSTGSTGDATTTNPTTTTTQTTSTTDTTFTTSEVTTDADSSTTEPLVCNGTSVRIVTYNVKSVGFEDTEQWSALGTILARLAPDLICFQEVGDDETAPLRALTMALGWGEPVQAESSNLIGGELHNACLGPHPMSRIASYGNELSSDPNASDVARDFLGVRLVHDGCPINVIAVHAKSGQEPVDFFRRQVELIRLGQAIEDVRAQYGDDPLVVMGDFNENPDDPGIGTVFESLPAGLPQSYELGDDIPLPLMYDPFVTVDGFGITRVEPTHEDSPRMGTWGVDADFEGIRLDYVWLDGPQLDGTIVYDACRDDGVDEDPQGQWLPLAGDPVACEVSALASDHLPIVVDLAL